MNSDPSEKKRNVYSLFGANNPHQPEFSEKTLEKQKKWLTVYAFILYNTWCVIGSGKSLKAQARAGVNNSFDQEV